jgi:transcription elongation factor S-II
MLGEVLTIHDSAIDLILPRARAIESAVWKENGGTTPAYRSRIRTLYVNLKDKNNPTLREGVVNGDLPVERFCNMTSQVRPERSPTSFCLPPHKASLNHAFLQEMASEERRAADAKIKEENLYNSLGAEEQQAETDAFQCGRCKQVRFHLILSVSSDRLPFAEKMQVSTSADKKCG